MDKPYYFGSSGMLVAILCMVIDRMRNGPSVRGDSGGGPGHMAQPLLGNSQVRLRPARWLVVTHKSG